MTLWFGGVTHHEKLLKGRSIKKVESHYTKEKGQRLYLCPAYNIEEKLTSIKHAHIK